MTRTAMCAAPPSRRRSAPGDRPLWRIAQVGCAINKPKAFLPWFGLHVYAVVLVVLGFVTAAISVRMWQTARPDRTIAQQEAPRPAPEIPGQKQEPPKNVEP